MVSHIITPSSRLDKSLLLIKLFWEFADSKKKLWSIVSQTAVMSNIYISSLQIIHSCTVITLLVTGGHSTDDCYHFFSAKMRLVVESDWQLWHTDCVQSSNPTCLHLGKATGGVISSRTLCNQWGDRNLSGGLNRKSCLSSYCLHWTFSAPNPIITLTMQRDCKP